MHFETVNERGTAERLSDNGRFRFTYGNDFYGSCTFTVDVFLCKQKTLLLREHSIVIEDYHLKKGDVKALLNVSITFFKRILLTDAWARQGGTFGSRQSRLPSNF